MVFASQSQRDLVVESLNKQEIAMTSRVIWVATSHACREKVVVCFEEIIVIMGLAEFETRVNISSRSLSIDGKLIIPVNAHDQQFDVRFADQWQDL